MEKIVGREAIRTALQNAGVTNLDSGSASSYLPKKGQFNNWEIIPKNDSAKIPAYAVMTGTNGTRVSIGTLKMLGISTETMTLAQVKEKIEQNKDTKKWTLKGVQVVNPNINGSKDATIDMLLDKYFVTEAVEMYVLPYKPDGYATKAEAQNAISVKRCWRVNEISETEIVE